eukprot:CAMPEP_0167753978 /NCGR_PEP_ID=MMETSP0110_2-20121227/8014_1 /TAXON_ID=629695 /ORGANISM="Gymnochlora sp., Strain CCMP2014" /LENGTH=909 /DNA_ID=CAMNT_0007639805 /DNA_START=59 /DNA_END=2788 /DNA_ORIENTATION=+
MAPSNGEMGLKTCLNMIKDQSKVWAERIRAMAKLPGVLQDDLKGLSKADIKAITDALKPQIAFKRGDVVRQVCITITQLIPLIDGTGLEVTYAENILNTLGSMGEAGISYRRFFLFAGQKLCYNIQSKLVIDMICQKTSQSLSSDTVGDALLNLGFLFVVVFTYPETMLESSTGEIESCVCGAISSSSKRVQMVAISCAQMYISRLPSRASPLTSSLDPLMGKRLIQSEVLKEIPSLLYAAHLKPDHALSRKKRLERKRKGLKAVRLENSEMPEQKLNLTVLSTNLQPHSIVSSIQLKTALVNCGLNEKTASAHCENFWRISSPDSHGRIESDDFVSEFQRLLILIALRKVHAWVTSEGVSRTRFAQSDLQRLWAPMIPEAKTLVSEIFKAYHSKGLTIDKLEEWYTIEEDLLYESRMLERNALKNSVGIMEKIKALKPVKLVQEVTVENANVIVLCGPSAVGKGTLLGMLKKKYPGMFGVAVSHTTRAPRVGEENGKHYHFVDKSTFLAMKNNGDFLEWADVHGNFYGTSKAAVKSVCENGGICILEIDVQGAKTIKSSNLELIERAESKGPHLLKTCIKAKYLFITTSGGLEELEKRLRGRGTESEPKIQKRLKTSARELEFLKENEEFFDCVLVNDDVKKAAEKLKATMTSWFPDILNEKLVKARQEEKTKAAAIDPSPETTPQLSAMAAPTKSEIIVLCGPSAVGKGTILGIMKKRYPGMFGVAVSHTTRNPRQGEVDGKHYHFTDKATFESMIKNGEFLESAQVHGNYYGTSKASVFAVCKDGGICILEIDVQGAESIKKQNSKAESKGLKAKGQLSAKYMFITTSGGLSELEKRLRGRGTESEPKIQKRLKTSKREIEFLKANPEFFDFVLVNDQLEEAVGELRETFLKWYPQLESSVKFSAL